MGDNGACSDHCIGKPNINDRVDGKRVVVAGAIVDCTCEILPTSSTLITVDEGLYSSCIITGALISCTGKVFPTSSTSIAVNHNGSCYSCSISESHLDKRVDDTSHVDDRDDCRHDECFELKKYLKFVALWVLDFLTVLFVRSG